MVTLVAGAVAVGIVSVCAIPFGCFLSRKMRKKVVIPPDVAYHLEIRDEEPSVGSNGQVGNPGLAKSVEHAQEAQQEIDEMYPRFNYRVPRVEIMVLVANASTKSSDVQSQGYVTGPGTSDSSSSQSEASAQAIEARRRSLQILASAPAADRQNRGGSSSLPTPARIPESSNRESQDRSETTRLEITISGGFPKNGAQFGMFKNDVQDSSTPKSKSNGSSGAADSTVSHENRERDSQRSSFWRRASFNRNGPPRIFKTTRDIEIINVEVVPGDDLRRRINREPLSSGLDEERYSGKNESLQEQLEAAGPSEKNGKNCNRGRWGLPSRFFETLKETTSFTSF